MLRVPTVTNGPACAADDLAEHVVVDVDTAPDGGNQLVTAYPSVTVLNQVDERIEDFWLKPNPSVRTPKLTFCRNQVELAEAIRGLVHDCTNALRAGDMLPEARSGGRGTQESK